MHLYRVEPGVQYDLIFILIHSRITPKTLHWVSKSYLLLFKKEYWYILLWLHSLFSVQWGWCSKAVLFCFVLLVLFIQIIQIPFPVIFCNDHSTARVRILRCLWMQPFFCVHTQCLLPFGSCFVYWRVLNYGRFHRGIKTLPTLCLVFL